MASDREVLEDAGRVLAEQAADSDRIVEEALEAGLAADDRVVVYTKMLRLELLNTKAAFERQLEQLGAGLLQLRAAGPLVSGIGVTPGHGRIGSRRRTASLRCE